MNDKVMLFCIKLRYILSAEDGQDLIEYALVVALIALGATAGMSSLATAINNAFLGIGTKLSNCTSGTGTCN